MPNFPEVTQLGSDTDRFDIPTPMLLALTRAAPHNEALILWDQTASPVLTLMAAAFLALWGLGQMRPERGMGEQ